MYFELILVYNYAIYCIWCFDICQVKAAAVSCRAGVNSKRIGIDQFNSSSIPELEWELELKDFEQNELNWNWKILNKMNWIGIEFFWIEFELKDFELNWNWIFFIGIE